MSQVRYANMFERLIANSRPLEGQNANGCWEWTGRTDGRRWPYGVVTKRVAGKHTTTRAHREMEQQLRDSRVQLDLDDAQVGDWWATPLPTAAPAPLCPDTETIDHLCYCRLCIHPDHWEAISRVENSVRSQQRRSKR